MGANNSHHNDNVIIVNSSQVQVQNLRPRGFEQLPNVLNEGAGGNQISISYKKGSTPITKLQVSFNDEMAAGLTNAGYTKFNKDLNEGAGGDPTYLWYYQGSGEYDTPIVEFDVTTDARGEVSKFRDGWERLACDLTPRSGGATTHLWVKRENPTFICDITATDSYGSDTDLLGSGYMRVDADTNRGAGGSKVFIWYRKTTDPMRALTDLQVSISDQEAHAFKQQGFTSVSVNLNEKTGGNPVHLWYKKRGSKKPIRAITPLFNKDMINDYSKAGLTVIVKNLNSGNDGSTEYLCLYQ